ncbi:MAG: class I SAM-dependent methyltransferase [Bacteroidales bacterium]|nr:class I SAM-dependent methyltransferase [Bacteroidales bacterium]
MQQFWDQRYSIRNYVYGKDPNDFFKSVITNLAPGKILLPGEGEGRNAVYASRLGWNVTAFDVSTEGKNKALKLAEIAGVTINYEVNSYLDFIAEDHSFDMIGLFYTHQPPLMRHAFHKKLIRMLNPGGLIILEGFEKKQIEKTSGGPGNIDLLFNEENLYHDFMELEIEKLETVTRELKEGKLHNGDAVTVQLIAHKNSN